MPKCINGFLHFQWDEYAGDRDGEKEKPKQKYKDFPDCIRYILVKRPSYQKRVSPIDVIAQREQMNGHRFTGYNYGG